MKKININHLFVFLFLISFLFSCKKDDLIIKNENYEKIISKPENNKTGDTGKGEIACWIRNDNGTIICAGKRCGTPIGKCGKKYTNCKCLTSTLKLINGVTLEEFNQIWSDKLQRNKLIEKGFYEEDIK